MHPIFFHSSAYNETGGCRGMAEVSSFFSRFFLKSVFTHEEIAFEERIGS